MLRVRFSDLREHRFRHNFNCNSPTCECNLEPETNEQFLLKWPRFSSNRDQMLNTVSLIVNDITVLPHSHLCDMLLFGSNVFNKVSNCLILEATIDYLKKTKRFKNYEAFSFDSEIT